MSAETINEDFGITDEELRIWSQTFKPDLIESLDGHEFLITDGDAGIALISYSNIHDGDGFTIALIDCNYCELNFEMLMYAYGGILKNVVKFDHDLQEEE